MSEHDGHIELERRIDSIVVGTRHRQHPADGIEPLMMSIQKLGLLQPVTITPDGVLVCGARRLEAVKRLGWRTLKVWVRSGISDDLSRLLAQQDENAERRPLNQREQAALFRELRTLIAEDAHRRQLAGLNGQDGAAARQGDRSGSEPERDRSQGESRHQAAVAVTGKASYHHLERISTIERIAADRSLPEVLRKLAEAELEDIAGGGDVKPAFERVMRARELIAADDTTPTGPVTEEELESLANEAIELVKQKRKGLGAGGTTNGGKPKPRPSHRTLRAFVLTWGDLDGWSRFYNPTEIASQIKATDWEMFERVLAETIAFADEVRELRSTPISA